MLFTYTNNSIFTLNKFDVNVTYSVNKINVQIYRKYIDKDNNEYTYTFLDYTLNRYELVQRDDFTDYCEYGLYLTNQSISNITWLSTLFNNAELYNWTSDTLKKRVTDTFNSYNLDLKALGKVSLVNITKMTYIFEDNNDVFIEQLLNSINILRVFIPFKFKFDNCPIVITKFNDRPLTISKTAEQEVSVVPDTHFEAMDAVNNSILDNEIIHNWMKSNSIPLPVIYLTVDKAIPIVEYDCIKDRTYTFYAYLFDKLLHNPIKGYEPEVYIETINGIADKQLVKIEKLNGLGKFKVSTGMLEKYDTIIIKFRFKYSPVIFEAKLSIHK